jgi:Protein of unknown function (DUF2917)
LDQEVFQNDHWLLIQRFWSLLENTMDRTVIYQDLHQIEHQSDNFPAPTLSGYWKLEAGHALTLRARQAGVLRITHGRVWLTFDITEKNAGVRTGDYFLSRGESLNLSAGEVLVMEPYGLGHEPSAYYSWEAVAASLASESAESANWRANVLQPLADLRLALGLTLGASGRLARGLGMGIVAAGVAGLTGFATIFIAARARNDWAECAFKAQSGDKRAQGNIN